MSNGKANVKRSFKNTLLGQGVGEQATLESHSGAKSVAMVKLGCHLTHASRDSPRGITTQWRRNVLCEGQD